MNEKIIKNVYVVLLIVSHTLDIMGDFYITLQSDSSLDYFPNNTISNFKNHFSETVRLEDEFEVALVECSYVHSSLLVCKGDKIGDAIGLNRKGEIHAKRDLLDVADLEAELEQYKNEVDPLHNDILIIYQEMYSMENVSFIKEVKNFKFTPRLENVLGWSNERKDYSLGIFPSATRTQLYVYCSIIEGQRVGSEVLPLLRKMSYVGKHNEIMTRSFSHLQYASVGYNEIDNIWIYIRNESGDPPPFTSGTFSCTLHFRRKRY